MKLFFQATLSLLVVGCSTQSPHDSTIKATDSQTSSGRLNCDSDMAGCILTGADLAPSPGIHMTWLVVYDMPCVMTGRAYESTIEIRSGNEARRMVFGGRNVSLEVSGEGPLSLIDVHPAATRSFRFDHGTGCGLTLSWTGVPSVQQVSTWTLEVNRIKQGINDNLAMYASRRDVEAFLDIYIESPSPATKSILELQIVSLRASSRQMDHIKANQLQLILDNKPREKILAPYLLARKTIEETYIPQANALLAILTPWEASLVASINSCLAEASDQLN